MEEPRLRFFITSPPKKWKIKVLQRKTLQIYLNCCLRSSATTSDGVLFVVSAFVFSFLIKSASKLISSFEVDGCGVVNVFTFYLVTVFVRITI